MDRDGCRRAWLDLAPRKHRDRHGPMGPDDSSAAAGVIVVQRRRWIGMEPMMGAFKAVALKKPTGHRALRSGWR